MDIITLKIIGLIFLLVCYNYFQNRAILVQTLGGEKKSKNPFPAILRLKKIPTATKLERPLHFFLCVFPLTECQKYIKYCKFYNV